MAIIRNGVGARMCEAAIHNGVIYLAGQVAEDPQVPVTEQTQSVLARIDSLLAKNGSDKQHILQATIFLTDIRDFAAMNAVWDAWVPQGHTPARATIEARLAAPAYRVEMQIIAAQK
ncbi:MAG: RidA family protein [Burkholderiaceae bacterium]|nr:RidA family protein [Burkholderiaceae bacterium]